MPCLFHTGVFTTPRPMPDEGISSAHCMPIYLDTLVNAFPDLVLIIAHMGICHGEVAATLARIHDNVYLDLSGSSAGWRSSKPTSWFREMLYWEDAWTKVLFGSDVHESEVEDALAHQKATLGPLGWPEGAMDAFLGENARRIFLL